MSSWGATDADEAKPKWLSATEKTNTYATEKGWVFKNGQGQEEILVAIGNLSSKLNVPDVTAMNFVTGPLVNGSRTITVDVTFNEEVVVTGTPRITVANGNQSTDGDGNYTLDYASGSGTNKLRFSKASQTVSTNDVHTIGGGSSAAITLNSGTIKDKKNDSVASITIATATAGSTTFPTAAVATVGEAPASVATVNTLVAKVFSATVVAGGSNYSVGNEITIADGFGTGTNAVLTVATVNSGAVLTATVKPAAPGVYSAIASGVTGIGQESVNAGSGSGATFNLTLAVASLAVNAAGAGYNVAPAINLSGTGLTQSATAVMGGQPVALATTGAAAETQTVTAS